MRGGALRAIAAAVAFALVVSLPASAAGARDEARLAEAGALLEREAQWPDAIAIYRALVEADPDWSEPRLQLARVLAWKGEYDESLAHFDHLAASASPPPELAIERAEVLSWAGRTDEAQAGFEKILAAQPRDARAARGLARVYRWSGQKGRADRWYETSLGIEDDAEARSERDAMRAELKSEMTGGARAFFDSDDFSYVRSDARFARDLGFDTRLYASSATFFVDHDREEGAPLDGETESLRGFESRLGIEQRLGARTRGLLEVGGRYWDHADAVPVARASVEFDPRENTSLGLELSYEDMLERSYSLESVLENVRRSAAKASAWRQLTPAIEGYAEAGSALLSGSNAEFWGGTSFAWKPFAEREVRLALSLDAQRYQEHSDYYYSPELDLGATLSLMGRLPVHGPLAFTFDVGGGGGLSQEQGETEMGPAYRVKAGFAWRRGGFSIDADVARSQSVRAIAYTTHEAVLRVGWTF